MGDQYYDGHLINYSSNTGYPTIWNGSENVLLHRYVWEKYNGPIPEGYQVHHLDKNRLNFDISNLCIIPASDHARHHAIENGLGKSNKGKLKTHDSGFCKGAISVRLTRGNEVLQFPSVTEAAKFLESTTSKVSGVCRGRRKTVKGWSCSYDRRKEV